MNALTEEQVETIIAAVKAGGPQRAREQGDEFSESDFLAGVMTVFYALNSQQHLPPWWYLGVMSGRPVLLEEESHERLKARQEERRNAAKRLGDALYQLKTARHLLSAGGAWGRRCAEFLEEECE